MPKFRVDFSGVSDSMEVKNGKYKAKVKSITQEEGKDYPYLKWTLVLLTGSAKGAEVSHITSMKPSALFNLRNTLIACGFNIPKSAVTFDPAKVIGKTLGVEITQREYEGREYPNVKKTFPAGDFEMETVDVKTTTDDGEEDMMIVTDDDL